MVSYNNNKNILGSVDNRRYKSDVLKFLAMRQQMLGKTDMMCKETTHLSASFFEDLSVIISDTG